MPHVAKVLASAANYMICDDHEFTDDLGDEPEHSNPSSIHFYVATLAYQVYNEYQHQLLMDVDGEKGARWMDVLRRGVHPRPSHASSVAC